MGRNPVGNAPKDSPILLTYSGEDLRDAGIRLPTGTRFFVQPEGLTNAPSYNATSTPNQYADYDLSTKDGMRKLLDDKSWQISSGVAVSSDEITTAKAMLSSYFGFEGNEKLMAEPGRLLRRFASLGLRLRVFRNVECYFLSLMAPQKKICKCE
jgi:hypothetical protein